ncbi:hypothetical protein ACFL6O_01845 [candidate division KSB1 bacterium]
MPKNLIISILLFALSAFACSSPTDTGYPEPFDVPVEDIVAFSARIEEEDGDYHWRLVLMDFNDKSNYKILNPDSVNFYGIRFSPGKDKILFNGEGSITIFDAYPQFFIYRINNNSIEPLQRKVHEDIYPIHGAYPVWFNDESGFYFWSFSWSIVISKIFYYEFEENYSQLLDTGDYGVRVLGVMKDDSIIAFNRGSGMHLFDKNGNYVSKIVNYNLDRFCSNSIDYGEYGSYLNVDWHSGTERFVIADSTIAITDINNSIYISFEETFSNDYAPVWGPNSESILFLRGTTGIVMHIDTETGNVTEYLHPDDIGAMRILSLDY